jgi:hypothetical protein
MSHTKTFLATTKLLSITKKELTSIMLTTDKLKIEKRRILFLAWYTL